MFSFEELKKYTKNFSQVNGIGSGGFGKVLNVSTFKLERAIVI